MIKDGQIVSVLFLAFIIILYSYFSINAMDEMEELIKINDDQAVHIEEQQKEMDDMHRLIEAMFMYIEAQQRSPVGPSPLHDSPPWSRGGEKYNRKPI
jgi:hypothetical protein